MIAWSLFRNVYEEFEETVFLSSIFRVFTRELNILRTNFLFSFNSHLKKSFFSEPIVDMKS